MSEVPVKQTHGAGITWRGKDGVQRYVSVCYYDNAVYVVEFKTWLDGDDSEPLLTEVRLSADAYQAFSNLLLDFNLNREQFAVPGETTVAQA